MKPISQRCYDPLFSSHPPKPASHTSPSIKRVHFSACITDIAQTLIERTESRNLFKRRGQQHCRPILKYSKEMNDYLRTAGTTFARGLAQFGKWCSGVTSANPNVRSDMYKQLLAQLRSTSQPLRHATESVLQANIPAMWVQLLEDFSICRYEYTKKDVILRDNAAQVIGMVLANHRYLEKLHVGDVQEFILQVVNRVEIHLRNRWPVDDRLEVQLWLLAIEVTGWWDEEATFYSPRMCQRLYDVITQINFRQHTPDMQRALLELFRIIYSRHPNLQGLEVEPVLNIAWDYMWDEEELVRTVARKVVTLIADHRGGDLNIFQVIQLKISSAGIFRVRIYDRLHDEFQTFPDEALELWMIITRLLKEHITYIGPDLIRLWIDMPTSDSILFQKTYSRKAGIMISYLLYYIGDFIEKHPRLYDRLPGVFTKQGHRNPLLELKALDNCLNAHYFDNPITETICPDRVRPRENLKLWARLTVDALAYGSRVTITYEEDLAIARLFCHWEAMLRGMTMVKLHEGYDEEQQTQDILDVCEILGHENFCKRIQDPYDSLGKRAKHAVYIFWVNLMATITSRDTNIEEIFPVETLRSLLPMILAGLRSTQLRIRQATYRFLTGTPILGGVRWLKEKDGIELLKAMKFAGERFEARIFDKDHAEVPQIHDYGSLILEYKVEEGELHPGTLRPVIPVGTGDIKWVWYHPDGKECQLGEEEVFALHETIMVNVLLFEKEEREKERRAWVAAKKVPGVKGTKKKKPKKADLNDDSQPSLSRLPQQASAPPPEASNVIPSSDATASSETSQPARQGKIPSQSPKDSASTPLQFQPPVTERPAKSASPSPSTYDKRIPPPCPDWRSAIPEKKRKPPSQEEPTTSQEKKKVPLTEEEMLQLLTEKGVEVSELDDPIYKMMRAAQKPDAPPAKGSLITGKRDQLEIEIDAEMMDEEEGKMINEYLRAGDDRIGILPDGWREVQDTPTIVAPSRKRSHDDEDEDDEGLMDHILKKRKLKSDYCPATHTTWKPAWLDTMQCYPVDESGEDMSDVQYLRGDGIHRSADRMKWILEKECMFIPSHRVDELLSVAQETVKALERTKEYYDKEHQSKVRIERHEFM